MYVRSVGMFGLCENERRESKRESVCVFACEIEERTRTSESERERERKCVCA